MSVRNASTIHVTFHPDPPAPIQRGLSMHDQDTIALLVMHGVGEPLVERVADSLREAKRHQDNHKEN